MEYTNIRLIYFSPTNTTKKIVESIARGIHIDNILHLDLTYNNTEFIELNNELAIIGVPVYSGRVPKLAAERLGKIKSKKSLCILVVVYGNRAYDDALIELRDLVTEQGFKSFSAAAFIGEHSFSTKQIPLSEGRPDKNDLSKARNFGIEIKQFLNEHKTIDKPMIVPGNFPYKIVAESPDISPITIESKCDKCGICVNVCPTHSIQLNQQTETDNTSCILCSACVKACPNKARLNDSKLVKKFSDFLAKNCSTRKEPETYIAGD